MFFHIFSWFFHDFSCFFMIFSWNIMIFIWKIDTGWFFTGHGRFRRKDFGWWKKKFHKKIQKNFLVNFASIRMPLRCISWPVEVICPKKYCLTDGGGDLKYIPLQLTGKVYCDRQFKRATCARESITKIRENDENDPKMSEWLSMMTTPKWHPPSVWS